MKTAYGIISPNIRITSVDITKPTAPLVYSDIKIENRALTETFPSRIVQRRRFPLFLKGRIFLAYFASFSSYNVSNGPIVRSSRYFGSKPITPKLSPANMADKRDKPTTIRIFHQTIGAVVLSLRVEFVRFEPLEKLLKLVIFINIILINYVIQLTAFTN